VKPEPQGRACAKHEEPSPGCPRCVKYEVRVDGRVVEVATMDGHRLYVGPLKS
jgi:hypothetical protein